MIRIYSIFLISSFLLANCDTTLEFDNSKWSYDSTNNVYYQLGIKYCTNVVSTDYQTMGFYVPGEFLTCTQSGSLYNCEINKSGKKGNYTASNAPIVMPVETPGYAAMKAPTEYKFSDVSAYINAGIIFAYAGCRGKYDGGETFIAGAPWCIVDL